MDYIVIDIKNEFKRHNALLEEQNTLLKTQNARLNDLWYTLFLLVGVGVFLVGWMKHIEANLSIIAMYSRH